MPQTPHVFISYARNDGEAAAEALLRFIEDRGLEVWRDREGMRGGAGWGDQIQHVLDAVEYMVVVMTPGAVVSRVVRKEWDYARRQGVCIYAVIAAGGLSWSEMPIWMRKGHCYDLRNETQAQKFINDLKSSCQATRVPFMVEDLPANYVLRSGLFDQLITTSAPGMSSTTASSGPLSGKPPTTWWARWRISSTP